MYISYKNGITFCNTGSFIIDNITISRCLLSEELKSYYYKVTTAIKNLNSKQQDIVILSILNDPGLQEVIPFFIRYIQKELYCHMDINNTNYNNDDNNNKSFHNYNYNPIDHYRTLIRLTR